MKFRKRHYILLALALLALAYLFVNRGGSYLRALDAPEKLNDVSATPSPAAPAAPDRPLEVPPEK